MLIRQVWGLVYRGTVLQLDAQTAMFIWMWFLRIRKGLPEDMLTVVWDRRLFYALHLSKLRTPLFPLLAVAAVEVDLLATGESQGHEESESRQSGFYDT